MTKLNTRLFLSTLLMSLPLSSTLLCTLICTQSAFAKGLSADELAFANKLLHPGQVTSPLSTVSSPAHSNKALALLNNKKLALGAVARNGLDVKYAHPRLRDDFEVMMRAVRQNGMALRYASKRLKDDRKLVRVAVTSEPFALQFASKARRDDKSIVRIAVQRPSTRFFSGNPLQFVSERLKKDREIILLAAKQNARVLKYLDPLFANDLQVIKLAGLEYGGEQIRNNKNFLLSEIRKHPDQCRDIAGIAGKALKQDRDFLLRVFQKKDCSYFLHQLDEKNGNDLALARIAVSRDGETLKLFAKAVRDNKQIVLLALGENRQALQYASQRLRNDKQVVLSAIRGAGFMAPLEYASDRLRDDEDVVRAAVSEYGFKIEYASQRLRKNRKMALAAVSANPNAIMKLDERLKKDKQIALAALKRNSSVFPYIAPELKTDRDILAVYRKKQPQEAARLALVASDNKADVLAAVRQQGELLQYASQRFKKDRDVVLAAVRKNGEAIQFADKSLRNDKKLLATALKSNPDLVRFAKRYGVRLNRQIVLRAMRQSAFYFDVLNKRYKQDREIVEAAIHAKTSPLAKIDKDMVIDDAIVNALIDKQLNNSQSFHFQRFFHHLSRPVMDKSRMQRILHKNALLLEYASPQLKRDRQLVLAAVRQNGAALAFADAALKRDRVIVQTAINQSAEAYDFADPQLKTRLDVAMLATGKGNKHVLKRLYEMLDEASARLIIDSRHVKPLGKSFFSQKIQLETKGVPAFYSAVNNTGESPVFQRSRDGKKIAGFLQMRPQGVTFVAIWDARNGRLLYSTRLPFNYPVMTAAQVRFTPDGKTLVGGDRFIWRFAKAKKPLYCNLDSNIIDRNNHVVLTQPNDWVDGIYDLRTCKTLVLANSMSRPHLAIGARNRLLMISPKPLDKELKAVLLYKKKPDVREHFNNYAKQVELWEIPTLNNRKNAHPVMWLDYSKKQLLLMRYDSRKTLAISKWNYIARRRLWRKAIQNIDAFIAFDEVKRYSSLNQDLYYYQIDFSNERLYLQDNKNRLVLNLKTGKLISKRKATPPRYYPGDSMERSGFYQSVVSLLDRENIETLEVRPDDEPEIVNGPRLAEPLRETVWRVSTQGDRRLTLWKVRARRH